MYSLTDHGLHWSHTVNTGRLSVKWALFTQWNGPTFKSDRHVA